MDKLAIKTHDFEDARNRIKAFSQQSPIQLQFNKVEEEGGFLYLGDHKVTGTELNELTTKIQDFIFNINKWNKKIIEEFGDVYKAVNALDKDYIQWILENVEAVNVSMMLHDKLITKFKDFKQKVEAYEHLQDVDQLWDDALIIQEEILSIKSDLVSFNTTTEKLGQAIEKFNQFKTKLEELQHLKDIDLLWDQSESQNDEISSINNKLNDTTQTIKIQAKALSKLMEFKDKLDSLDHLEEIDETWENYKTIEMDLAKTKELINIHEQQISELKNHLIYIEKQNDETGIIFSKKLKVSNVLAGCFIGISLLQLIMLLIG